MKICLEQNVAKTADCSCAVPSFPDDVIRTHVQGREADSVTALIQLLTLIGCQCLYVLRVCVQYPGILLHRDLLNPPPHQEEVFLGKACGTALGMPASGTTGPRLDPQLSESCAPHEATVMVQMLSSSPEARTEFLLLA